MERKCDKTEGSGFPEFSKAQQLSTRRPPLIETESIENRAVSREAENCIGRRALLFTLASFSSRRPYGNHRPHLIHPAKPGRPSASCINDLPSISRVSNVPTSSIGLFPEVASFGVSAPRTSVAENRSRSFAWSAQLRCRCVRQPSTPCIMAWISHPRTCKRGYGAAFQCSWNAAHNCAILLPGFTPRSLFFDRQSKVSIAACKCSCCPDCVHHLGVLLCSS